MPKLYSQWQTGGENDSKKEPKKGYTSDLTNAFKEGLVYGTRFNKSGWGEGLTIHTCMMNIVPYLGTQENRANALFHGLSAIAQDCALVPPRFQVSHLPQPWPHSPTIHTQGRTFQIGNQLHHGKHLFEE